MQSLSIDKKFNNLPLAITMGEPGGINSEIFLKAVSKTRAIKKFIICDPSWIETSLKLFKIDLPINIINNPSEIKLNSVNIFPTKEDVVFRIGKPNKDNNAAIIESIDTAVRLAKNKKVLGIVTLPIYKKILMDDGFKFPGHTEYLSHKDKSDSLMILMTKKLKVATATTHVPISEVSSSLNKSLLINKISILNKSLIEDFNITYPKIAISSLNPHAGEEGRIGKEEIDIIIPAIEELNKNNINAKGPFPADTLFNKDNLSEFDARLCMFHDQAMIPIKTLDFFNGINFTSGLSFVRTSPDHGTAFNISGKNIANPDSLISSIKNAVLIAKNRNNNA